MARRYVYHMGSVGIYGYLVVETYEVEMNISKEERERRKKILEGRYAKTRERIDNIPREIYKLLGEYLECKDLLKAIEGAYHNECGEEE